ncbi:MAG: hypothetical protein ACPGNV_10485 [Mangrovicoccus sp.]
MALEELASEALETLANAPGARSDPEGTEKAVKAALEKAPFDLDIRLGAYRFYFYTHRYAQAYEQAQGILALAAQRLNISPDWRAVQPQDAEFTAKDFAPGLYLQALIALGYCQLRLGEFDLGEEYVEVAAKLDPTDRFGAVRVLRQAVASRNDEAELDA